MAVWDTSVIWNGWPTKGYEVICFGEHPANRRFCGSWKRRWLLGNQSVCGRFAGGIVTKYIFLGCARQRDLRRSLFVGNIAGTTLFTNARSKPLKRRCRFCCTRRDRHRNDRRVSRWPVTRWIREFKVTAPVARSRISGAVQRATDLINYATKHGIAITATTKKAV